MQEATDKCRNGLSVSEIAECVACTSPPNQEKANLFCVFVFSLVIWKSAPACDWLFDAGAIPVVVDMLRRYSAVKEVVQSGCVALHYLAKSGSALAKLALESIPDCVPLLRTAAASGLDLSSDNTSTATDVLKELGLHTEEAIAMPVCL